MGGHANGKEASQLATETIVDMIFPLVRNERVQGPEIGAILVDAAKQANAALYERNLKMTRLLDRMGTTAIIALVVGPHAFIANIGDSRAYLYRPGVGLRVLSQDHSIVAALTASGAITPDEVYTHPERNKVLRCLGTAPTVDVDLFYEQLQNGDTLLLCSDGLWEMVRDPQIEQLLASPWCSAEQTAKRLVNAALRGGGLDNIGLVVSQFQMHITAMQTLICSVSDYPTAS
jgi:serine/threonine protein phosphatase PrpC